jgi:hypothetical protein
LNHGNGSAGIEGQRLTVLFRDGQTVEFDHFDGWDEPLPSRMTEIYAQRTSPRLTRGAARYSNYRRFSVDITEKWKIPK